MNLTRGNGLMSHVFDEYAPVKEGAVAERRNGVLVSRTTARPSPMRCGSCRIAAACSSIRAKSCTKG